MNLFPLYDLLSNISRNANFKPEFSQQVALTINSLTKDHIIQIYSLILTHADRTGQLTTDKPPYGGKTNKKSKGVIYTFETLPEELRNVVILYVVLATV